MNTEIQHNSAMSQLKTELQNFEVMDNGSLIKQFDRNHEDLTGIAEHSLKLAITNGKILATIKNNLPHGEYEDFIETFSKYAGRTARQYKQLFQAFEAGQLDNCKSISEARQLLAEPKTARRADLPEPTQTDETPEAEPEPQAEILPVSVKATVIDNDKTPLDRFGQEIPETLQPVFGEVALNFKWWKQALESVKKEMMDNLDELGYEWLDAKYIKPRFDNIYELLRMAEPYCICPVCQGDGGMGAKCKVCLGRGRVTKPIFNAIPDDYKAGLKI